MRWGKGTEPLEVRGPDPTLPPLQEPGRPCQGERRLQQAKDRPTPPSAVHLLPRYSPRAPRGQGTEAKTPNLVWGHHTPDRRDLGQASYSTKETGGTEPGEPQPPPLHHPAWLTAGPPLLASQSPKHQSELPGCVSSEPGLPAFRWGQGACSPRQPLAVTSAKGLSQPLHWRPRAPGRQGHCPLWGAQEREVEPTG